jgi:hypothetical protein
MVILIWSNNPISFKHVSLWYLFLRPHQPTCFSNVSVLVRKIMVVFFLPDTLHFHALCLQFTAREVEFPHQDLEFIRGGGFFSSSAVGRRCQPWLKAPPLTCNSLSWKKVTCNHWIDWNVKLLKENALAHLACTFAMVECAWQTIKGNFGVRSWKAYYAILQNSTCHYVTKT